MKATTPRALLGRFLIAGLAAALALGLAACDQKPSQKKEQQKIKLLPDTPPPPPPPPKPEEKKPEPEKLDKPQQQLNQPKPDPTPQPQMLKSDEAPGEGAGGGPVAGTVTQDYQGGQIGSGTGGGNKLVFDAYGRTASRALNDFLNRDPEVKKRGDFRIELNVWVDADGRLKRSQLVGSTGNAQTDEALRGALERFPGLRGAPPENMPQPIRLQITNRMIG